MNFKCLIFDFLELYSRMEYALKATGSSKYLKKGNYNSAIADWNKFANNNSEKFIQSKNKDCIYLLMYPPKRQKVKNGSIVFEDYTSSYASNFEVLIDHIKNVRNNLFHGGKATDCSIFEENDRNKKLLESSIYLLKLCIDFDTSVKSCFKDNT